MKNPEYAHFSNNKTDITCIQYFYSRRPISTQHTKFLFVCFCFLQKTGYLAHTKSQTSIRKPSTKHKSYYLYTQSRHTKPPLSIREWFVCQVPNFEKGPSKDNNLNFYANFFTAQFYNVNLVNLFQVSRSMVILLKVLEFPLKEKWHVYSSIL